MKPRKTKLWLDSIRGWLPKEPNPPTIRLESKPKKLFSKRNMLVVAVGILIVIIIASSSFFYLMATSLLQSFSFSSHANPVEDAQNALSAYVGDLNVYNATAAWNLLSPNMQASYKTLQNFNDTFVNQLQARGWHAQIFSDDSGYGTITYSSVIPIQNSWTMPVNLGVALGNSSLTYKTVNFNIKSYGFSHDQPTDWKIDSKFSG